MRRITYESDITTQYAISIAFERMSKCDMACSHVTWRFHTFKSHVWSKWVWMRHITYSWVLYHLTWRTHLKNASDMTGSRVTWHIRMRHDSIVRTKRNARCDVDVCLYAHKNILQHTGPRCIKLQHVYMHGQHYRVVICLYTQVHTHTATHSIIYTHIHVHKHATI